MKWTIYDKTGSKVRCHVNKLEYNGEFMGASTVTCTVKSDHPIPFEIGDYLDYRGERYTINYDPSVIKRARANTAGDAFTYDGIVLNSYTDELVRCSFLDYVLNDNQIHFTSLPTFSFYAATVKDLADRIQANLNRIYKGDGQWTVNVHKNFEGEVNQNVSVNNLNVWDALALANTLFKANFIIRGRTITIGTVGVPASKLFQYGKGNGLKQIERTVESDQSVITRLRVYGSSKNMPARYYNKIGRNYFVSEVKDKHTSEERLVIGLDVNIGTEFKTGLFNNLVRHETGFTEFYDYKVEVKIGELLIDAHLECFTDERILSYLFSNTSICADTEKLKEAIRYLLANNPDKLYITKGVNLDVAPEGNMDNPKYMSDNMAVNFLMLPGFPETTLDPCIESKNIDALGVREGTVIFDGSEEGKEEIHPSIEGMTAEELKKAGIQVDMDEGDNGMLDEVYDAEQTTENGLMSDISDGKEVPNFTVTLKDIGFDINDHLSSDTATLSMKDGMCGGREFEIEKCERKGNKWILTCKRVEDSSLGLYFPYKDYNIKKGDKYVLLGIEMPEAYVKAASQRLLEAGKKYLSENDYVRYSYTPKIDDLAMARQHDNHKQNQEISIHDSLKEGDLILFEDSDLGISGNVILDSLTIVEGDSLIPHYEVSLRNEKTVGTLDKIQNHIDSILSGNGKGAGLNTEQVTNIVKALGAKYYLSKIKPDSTAHLLKLLDGVVVDGRQAQFNKGAQFGESFAGGLTGTGGRIDGEGYGELRSLKLWEWLEVPELRFNSVKVWVGVDWQCAGAGIIESVVVDLDEQGLPLDTGTVTLKLEEGQYGAVAADDIAMGIWHMEDTSLNATETTDDSKGNFSFAGFATSYFRIVEVSGAHNETVRYSLRPGYNVHPQPMMSFACYGNFTNEERQTSTYRTTTYTRRLWKQNTWEIGVQNIAAQDGDLSNLNVHGLQMEGYSAYLNNVYFTGVIKQVKPDGTPIITANDRGAWQAGKYDYYDRVSHNGCIWLCVAEAGTTAEPSESSADWLKQVDKGESGTQGIPGEPGKDGKTLYTWVRYADDAEGNGMSDSPTGKEYIGFAYNKVSSTESDNPTDYEWALFKGERGIQGLQGIQGKDGKQGIPGEPGKDGVDGKTTFFHIKYSANANGVPMQETPAMYIGTYVDFTQADSDDASKYTWSKFEGIDGKNGENGIPGKNGTDGKTSYLHIAYATSADGSQGFDISDPAGKTYIGQYTDFELSDSRDYTRYKWSLIKGDKGDKGDQGIQGEKGDKGDPGTPGLQGLQGPKGEQGIPGTPGRDGAKGEKGDTGAAGAKGEKGDKGADGKTSYFHIKYSANANGNPMTETPSTYIGTYVDYSPTDSTNPASYTWARFQGLQGAKGTDGIPGKNGVDGKTYYLHIKYSNDGGATFTGNSGEDTGKYIGVLTDLNQADSNRPADYKWSLIKGDKGDTGAKGDKGDKGATGATGPQGPQGAAGAQGVGVKSIANKYAVSASNTSAPSTWTDTVPTMTATNRYLWNYEIVTYTNGSTSTTVKRVIGVYGDRGATGATGPQGVKGDKGDQGIQGVQGKPGTNGTNGRGISSITEYYLASMAASGVTTSTSGWTTTMQATSTSKKYLWNYEVVKYSDGNSFTSTPVIIGTHGATGATGAQGPQGPQGAKGDKGATGATGPQGPKGDKGDTGSPGAKGDRGLQGIQGCIIRHSEWAVGVAYKNDEAKTSGTRYVDVALVRDTSTAVGWRAYKCRTDHTSSSSNKPSGTGTTTYWEPFALEVSRIFTSFILAKDASIDFIQGNELLIKDSAGTVVGGLTGGASKTAGTTPVRIWVGSTTPGNAPFRVLADGSLISSKANITGKIIATSGEIGNFEIFNGLMRNKHESSSGSSTSCGIQIMMDEYTNGTVSGYNEMACIGDVLPASMGLRPMAIFKKRGDYSENIAMMLHASGAKVGYKIFGGNANICIDAQGGVNWQTKKGDHWCMPGLLKVLHIHTFPKESVQILNEWGNGLDIVSVGYTANVDGPTGPKQYNNIRYRCSHDKIFIHAVNHNTAWYRTDLWNLYAVVERSTSMDDEKTNTRLAVITFWSNDNKKYMPHYYTVFFFGEPDYYDKDF